MSAAAQRIEKGIRWGNLIRVTGWLLLAAAVMTPLLLGEGYRLPGGIGKNYLLTIGIFIGIHAIIAVGLGLLMGYAGQVSLGHAAFYGLGAYTSAILTTKLGVPPVPAMLAGIVLTAVIALLLGTPTLRLHGHYLAMFTLGLGMIVQIVFNQARGLTGGFGGVRNIPHLGIGSWQLDTKPEFYIVVVLVLGLTLLMAHNLVNSRTGRALRALHESELAAAICGVDVARGKLQIFVISAVLASVAGSLYAHFMRFVSPGPFGFVFSVDLLIMVVVGGAASVWGPVAGAALFNILSETLGRIGEHIPWVADLDIVLFGAVLVAVVVFLPRGLVTLAARRRGRVGEAASRPEIQAEA